MTKPLPGVGVFGTGLTARAVSYLLRSSGFQIEAIWGRTEDEARDLAQLLNVPFYTCHIDDVLLNSQVELVCIQCPPFLQSQIAVKTLGIGKNVLCESPAGLTFADTERMLHAAKYYPQLMSLMTFYLRFLPTFLEMKKRIADGLIGRMQVIEMRVHCGLSLDLHYDWFHDHRIGGGVLANFGAHFIDIVAFISGQRANKVHGFLTTFQKHTEKVSGFREITGDDFCTFQMQMDGDIYCTCVLNNNVPGKFSYEILAIGCDGCLVAKDGTLQSRSASTSKEDQFYEVIEEDEHDIPKGLGEMFPCEISKQLPVPFCQGMLKFFESLKECFGQHDSRRWDSSVLKFAATFQDALYVQSVLESIHRSNKSSDWEQVASVDEVSSSRESQAGNTKFHAVASKQGSSGLVVL